MNADQTGGCQLTQRLLVGSGKLPSGAGPIGFTSGPAYDPNVSRAELRSVPGASETRNSFSPICHLFGARGIQEMNVTMAALQYVAPVCESRFFHVHGVVTVSEL
jgi:hypothetical protein